MGEPLSSVKVEECHSQTSLIFAVKSLLSLEPSVLSCDQMQPNQMAILIFQL
jgi:hypothetical protein